MTREGHNVVIGNSNTASANATKEVVTFTTPSADEAAAWAAEMEGNGYKVDIQFDEKEGVFICTAIK